MLKKITEYNSSTSQEIALSFVELLKDFEPMQAAIATLTNAPATISLESHTVAVPTQTKGRAMKINKYQAG